MWLHLSGQELEFYLHLSVWHTLWYKCSKVQHDPRMTKLSPWAIRTPTLCEFWVTVKETQIKRPSFFGGKLTRGWWLLKGCYHSEIRRPGWGLLIDQPCFSEGQVWGWMTRMPRAISWDEWECAVGIFLVMRMVFSRMWTRRQDTGGLGQASALPQMSHHLYASGYFPLESKEGWAKSINSKVNVYWALMMHQAVC